MTTNQQPDNTLFPLQYFFSGVDTIPPAFEKRLRINGYSLWDKLPPPLRPFGPTIRPAPTGAATPSGRSGIFAAPFERDFDQDPAQKLRYSETEQTCIEIEPDTYLLLSGKAEPGDFFRSKLTMPAGHEHCWISTAPGHAFLIPIAFIDSPNCLLPKRRQYRRGTWQRVPAPGYEEIAQIANTLYLDERGELDHELTDQDQTDAACKAIAINYELTPAEIAAMDVLTDAHIATICAILTDLPARRLESGAQKKTDIPPDSPDTGSGARAS